MNNPIRASLKALLLLAVLCLRSNIVLAQTEQVVPQGLEQGRWLVGGGLGGLYIGINDPIVYSYSQGGGITRYFSQVGVNVGTTIGYFSTNKLLVGAGFNTGIRVSGGEFFQDPAFSWTIGAGPFVRYYAIPLSNEAALFGGAYFGYSFSTQWGDGIARSTIIHQLNPSLNVGGTWFITKNIAIEGYVAYQRSLSFINERTLQFALGGTTIQSLFPAYSNNTGSLSIGAGFQIFLDKVF
jgi:hypothetical protein